MKKLLLILFIFNVLALHSQNSDSVKLIARFAPLSVLDPYRTTIQLGTELILNETFAYSVDFGIPVNLYFQDNQSVTDRTYFKLRTEFKYYFFSSSERFTKSYFGFEALYVPDKFTRFNDWYEVGEYSVQYEYAKINKFALGAILKVGYEKIFANNFVFDFNVAAGYKYRQHNILAYNTTISEMSHFEEWYASPDRHPGHYHNVFFTSSIKVGYLVLKK